MDIPGETLLRYVALRNSKDSFLADQMSERAWAASPAAFAALGRAYRDRGGAGRGWGACPAVAVALFERARRLARYDDDDETAASLSLDIAECLEELGDAAGALAAAKTALRGRDPADAPTAAALLGRVAPAVLGGDSTEALAYRRAAATRTAAARKVQRVWRNYRVGLGERAATRVQSRWRMVVAMREATAWQAIARGVRDDEGLGKVVEDEDARRERRQFLAELEDMSENQRERALAKRKKEDDKRAPAASAEDRVKTAERSRRTAGVALLRAVRGRPAGDAVPEAAPKSTASAVSTGDPRVVAAASPRYRLRGNGYVTSQVRRRLRETLDGSPGEFVDFSRVDDDLERCPYGSPARGRGRGAVWSDAAAPARVVAIRARPRGVPVAVATDDALRRLCRADAVVVRRALFTSADAVRIAEALAPVGPETPRDGPARETRAAHRTLVTLPFAAAFKI